MAAPRTHDLNGYTNQKCRCEICRAAGTAYAKKARRNRVERLAGNPDLAPHGIPSTYGNWGCRCSECTTAWTKDTIQRKKTKAGSATPGDVT